MRALQHLEEVTQNDCKTSVLWGVSETNLGETVIELHMRGWSSHLWTACWWICAHPVTRVTSLLPAEVWSRSRNPEQEHYTTFIF